ncbi:UNVERIFIED_CONTAM: hypothetical protein Sradi_5857800 [Sesamum radiatum]|uniref:Uncharacterized protein n=1 Tax=Sesamum radiatum TaxID=300843 RepID=A0AAW2KQD9_SESRA
MPLNYTVGKQEQGVKTLKYAVSSLQSIASNNRIHKIILKMKLGNLSPAGQQMSEGGYRKGFG